uniref:E3 ubiquitin-protein ligase ARIH2-like n=1 Tax=Scatophagus argus TaxID=75038 RepID=UPI001ED83C6A|nr:E3 ubiquitin-protein ligase ARIH2-like [Scatophagus argus]
MGAKQSTKRKKGKRFNEPYYDNVVRNINLNNGEKCYNPLDRTLTFVDGEDDLDFECNDYKSLRAKMSCGHAVTPMSLTSWCRRLLDEGECKFVCGQTNCDVQWSFDEVCKMALLTPQEKDHFEKKLFSNAAKRHLNIKTCPGCKSHVWRTDLTNLAVECTVCSVAKNKTFMFCWQCLNEWKGPAPRSDRCDNTDCQSPLHILKSCPAIVFNDVKGVRGCPSIRACPDCGLLVEHNKNQCKSMTCPRCKLKFCFVCLKVKCKSTDPFGPCPTGVAPRQTSLPVWRKK